MFDESKLGGDMCLEKNSCEHSRLDQNNQNIKQFLLLINKKSNNNYFIVKTIISLIKKKTNMSFKRL